MAADILTILINAFDKELINAQGLIFKKPIKKNRKRKKQSHKQIKKEVKQPPIHRYSFIDLCHTIHECELIHICNIPTKISSNIAALAIAPYRIPINPKTMIKYTSKKAYEYSVINRFDHGINGPYGIGNLFKDNKKVYCSAIGGNNVDIILDLQKEYTFTKAIAQSPMFAYTCPLQKVYIWIFNEMHSIENVEDICKDLFSKNEFEKLDDSIAVINPKFGEIERDETLPVVYIDGMKEKKGWRLKVDMPKYIKGRYILIKLLSKKTDKYGKDVNVDATYVGLRGFSMRESVNN